MNKSHLHRYTHHHRLPVWRAWAGWAFALLGLAATFLGGALNARAEETHRVNAPEPQAQTRVLEDAGTRIEEVHLRGHTQRIVVTPKTGALQQPYEIITGDGSRDLSPGVNTSRGAAGQRVWRVLNF
jgi:hypothetical protein